MGVTWNGYLWHACFRINPQDKALSARVAGGIEPVSGFHRRLTLGPAIAFVLYAKALGGWSQVNAAKAPPAMPLSAVVEMYAIDAG